MSHEAARARMVIEARSWIGTPYHVGGRVKGAGCDCASLLLEVLRSCGLAAGEELGIYSLDCWQHWAEEKYLFRMLRHSRRIAEAVAVRCVDAAPGTLALCRAGGSPVYNHGGIVVDWPFVVHSIGTGVQEVDASRDPLWSHQEIVLFDPFERAA